MQRTGEPGVGKGGGAERVHCSDRLLGQGQQVCTLGGDEHLAGIALDEGHAQPLLHVGEGLTQGGLRDPE